MADKPVPGAKLIIRHREKRFTRTHVRLSRRLERAGVSNMEKEKLPNGDAYGELHADQILVAGKVAAARLGGVIGIGDLIKPFIARD